MKDGRLSCKEILTLNYKEIIYMRSAGIKPSKIAAYISKKENTSITYSMLKKFFYEVEEPSKLEKIKANAVTLELMRSEDPDAFSFLHSNPGPSAARMQSVQPQARPQASQASSFGEPTFGAPSHSKQAETAQIQPLQTITPKHLEKSSQNQWLTDGYTSDNQTHPPRSVDGIDIQGDCREAANAILQKRTPKALQEQQKKQGLESGLQTSTPRSVDGIDTQGDCREAANRMLQKHTPKALQEQQKKQGLESGLQTSTPKQGEEGTPELGLQAALQTSTPRSVEDQLRELFAAKRTAASVDGAARASLPLYEKYKGRGFLPERDFLTALKIEISELAFGSSEYEVEDIKDDSRLRTIEFLPTYSDEELREIYPDVFRVLRHAPVDCNLARKVKLLRDIRTKNLNNKQPLDLLEVSKIIGVPIASRKLMFAIILAGKEFANI